MTDYRRQDLLGRKHFSDDYGEYYITAGTEGDYDKSDVYATARTNPERTYVIEIKSYDNEQYPRPYSKFIKEGIDYGYQIDYSKIEYLMKKWNEEGRIPIVYARFSDWTLTWDLRDIPYQERKKQIWTNADGQRYGRKRELTWQTYLYKDEAKDKKETVN